MVNCSTMEVISSGYVTNNIMMICLNGLLDGKHMGNTWLHDDSNTEVLLSIIMKDGSEHIYIFYPVAIHAFMLKSKFKPEIEM